MLFIWSAGKRKATVSFVTGSLDLRFSPAGTDGFSLDAKPAFPLRKLSLGMRTPLLPAVCPRLLTAANGMARLRPTPLQGCGWGGVTQSLRSMRRAHLRRRLPTVKGRRCSCWTLLLWPPAYCEGAPRALRAEAARSLETGTPVRLPPRAASKAPRSGRGRARPRNGPTEVYRATEAIDYVLGSTRALGHFQIVAGQCLLTLTIAEVVDLDRTARESAARLRFPMQPGQAGGGGQRRRPRDVAQLRRQSREPTSDTL